MKRLYRFLSIAALTVAGALACTELNKIPGQAGNGTVTLTTTISLNGSPDTRALDAAGHKTFIKNDQIAIIYKNTSGKTIKVVSTIQDTDISSDGKHARITVTLTNPKPGGDLRYIYPAAMAKATIAEGADITDDNTVDFAALNTQDGTLATIASKYDLTTFDGHFTSDGQLPVSASLTNRLAICEFTLRDGSTSFLYNAKRLFVVSGNDTYTIRCSTNDCIYVAMKPISNATVHIGVIDDNYADSFAQTVTNKTLEAGNLYPVTVSLQKMRSIPLTFEAIEDGYFSFMNNSEASVKYSKNGGSWNSLPTSSIELKAGETVSFRGANGKMYPSKFDINVVCYIYGNIMSLVCSDTNYSFSEAYELTADNTFRSLFEDQTKLRNHPVKSLVLPALTLKNNCYESMFYGCTGLTRAPILPAESLAVQCYYTMFRGCSNLNSVICLATDRDIYAYCYEWLEGVSATGTFTKATGATWNSGNDGIPSGWTSEDF